MGWVLEGNLMKRFLSVVSFVALLTGGGVAANAADCADDPRTTGLARTIAVDAAGGGFYGRLQYKETNPLLRPKEIVLTFDDGPHPVNTKSILETLDRHCVKATFFAVGRMALFAPKMLKLAAERGHTIGTHTWAHPKDAGKLPFEEAKVEIEKGFVATAQALGEPVAPFFRFPGLNDSPELNAYLASRDISVWSVDIVSGDTYPGQTPDSLVRSTMDHLRKMGRGIVLFHDLKALTAESLDSFLTQLRLEGFKVVHVVSNSSYKPNPALVARLDMSKHALEQASFTAIAPEGDVLPGQKNIMATGEVEVMKTEFIHIESSAPAPKRELAPAPKRESAPAPRTTSATRDVATTASGTRSTAANTRVDQQ